MKAVVRATGSLGSRGWCRGRPGPAGLSHPQRGPERGGRCCGEMEDGAAAAPPRAVTDGHSPGLFRGIPGRAGRACGYECRESPEAPVTATRSWPRSPRPARAGLRPAACPTAAAGWDAGTGPALAPLPSSLASGSPGPPGRGTSPRRRAGGRPLSGSAGQPLPPPAPPRLPTAPLNSCGGHRRIRPRPAQLSSRGLSQSFSRRVPPRGQSERKALEEGGQRL